MYRLPKVRLSTSPVGSMVKLENLFNGLHENIVKGYEQQIRVSERAYEH